MVHHPQTTISSSRFLARGIYLSSQPHQSNARLGTHISSQILIFVPDPTRQHKPKLSNPRAAQMLLQVYEG
ncbi:hypothetical protein ES288_D07G076900v1 [Gossypium darwinii]|uniref:Uncharacterized protein n=1 Tax=Gossypium darwinii TaxID=34276 RepID=A0A5D2BXJ8_GOSDA|nr:hypothetical protein ES288_D07G076900v1 [Gossypium darwinii]